MLPNDQRVIDFVLESLRARVSETEGFSLHPLESGMELLCDPGPTLFRVYVASDRFGESGLVTTVRGIQELSSLAEYARGMHRERTKNDAAYIVRVSAIIFGTETLLPFSFWDPSMLD